MMDDHDGIDRRSEIAAQGARRNVADQLVEMLIESQAGGSRNVVAVRIREVLEAESWREPRVMRAAIMELAVAAAAWAATLDTELEAESHLRRIPK